ncbi:MAG: ComEA family DNA-binding protein [Candidatus Saganbacteria bacterium]|nr:ComEA family DNA-binding protein [Candidatus Saganbacteria bacterium]
MDFDLTKEQQLIVLGLIAALLIGCAVMAARQFFPGGQPGGAITITPPKPDPGFTSLITVHLCGAVRREGVYKLKPGDRMLDALSLAGGARPSADLSAVNLAATVKDGEKILVPAKQPPLIESAASPAVGQKDKIPSPAAKVNLNTADEKALDSLPGVGPATAKAIVEYRRTKGVFARPEQLMEIPKFGKSKFERVKNMISI